VWIGGSTGSGKSTVTRVLAARHGLRVFPVDAFWYSHVTRLGELDQEHTPGEQWLGMTPAERAADFEALTRRRWPLVVADLAALPPTPPVIVEGPQVLPDLIPAGDHAVSWSGPARGSARCSRGGRSRQPPTRPGPWPTGSRKTASTASGSWRWPRRAASR
jgi:hypothetical protein